MAHSTPPERDADLRLRKAYSDLELWLNHHGYRTPAAIGFKIRTVPMLAAWQRSAENPNAWAINISHMEKDGGRKLLEMGFRPTDILVIASDYLELLVSEIKRTQREYPFNVEKAIDRVNTLAVENGP